MCPCPHAPSTARAGSSPQHNFVCPAPARQHAAEVQSSSAGHKFCPAARAPKGSWPHSPRPIGMDPPAPTPALAPRCLGLGAPRSCVALGFSRELGGSLGPPPWLCPLPELCCPTRAASAQILLAAPRATRGGWVGLSRGLCCFPSPPPLYFPFSLCVFVKGVPGARSGSLLFPAFFLRGSGGGGRGPAGSALLPAHSLHGQPRKGWGSSAPACSETDRKPSLWPKTPGLWVLGPP